MSTKILIFSIVFNLLVLIAVWFFTPLAWLLVISIPLLVLVIYDMNQTNHSLLRNYPALGRGRWLMEELRPFFQQYLLETETNGAPISRMFRSIAYQRAKNARETVPFGTQVDTYKTGYEWIGHSISSLHPNEVDTQPKIEIGAKYCTQPYQASILNVSAMSFGSLSKNAILALNKGASLGGFYHNTGEGGVSRYHQEHGGDLVWQIGTGYFGCRTKDGSFDPALFSKTANEPQIKMIEIKLSQGAKPGHGGILPGIKNTKEIAETRRVEPGTTVESPRSHSAFNTPLELVKFIQELRKLSNGKPIGFKLAIGRKSEFVAICKAMIELNDGADFITVDGGEGGTGAAPLEYSNSIGAPLREALAFVDDMLTGYGLRKDIKVIASGKVLTGFHLVKNLALGADLCNSARGMMFALGCVQSLTCNTNKCPTGVATQDPKFSKGLDPQDKATRVESFHAKTVHSAVDIMSSAGIASSEKLNRTHIFRRISQEQVKRYDDIFPHVICGAFAKGDYPERYRLDIQEASLNSFVPNSHLSQVESETLNVGHS